MDLSRIAVCLASVALLATGCRTTTAPARGGPPRELLVAYSEKLTSGAARLGALQEGDLSRLLLSAETCLSAREVVVSFQGVLSDYKKLLSDFETSTERPAPGSVEELLEKCDALRKDLEGHAVQLSLLVDSAENQFESRSLMPASPEQQTDIARSRELLAVMQKLSALASSVEAHLADLHSVSIASNPTDDGEPAVPVFHFLALYRLQSRDMAKHALRYETAWKRWTEEEVRKGRPDVAAEVFALVVTQTREHRPRSFQQLFELVDSCLGRPLALDVVERIESALARVEAVAARERDGRNDWNRALDRARAGVMLSRAHALGDPEEGSRLAGEAAKLNPYLADRVVRYLLGAARSAAEKRLSRNDYVAAVETFRRVLARGPVPERDQRVEAYRAQTIARAIKDADAEVDRGRFAAARVILTRATRLGRELDDKLRLNEAFHRYYHAHANSLFAHDVGKAIEVCEEILRIYPHDAEARKKVDRGRFILLQREIGDLDSSHERLGGARVFELVRDAVGSMYGDVGTNLCQELLADLESSWRRQIGRASDPGWAYRIALELARLDRLDGLEAKNEAAQALWEKLDAGVTAGNWDVVERCFDVYFAECPEVARPERFASLYVRLLLQLEALGEVKKLGRHLALFTRACPADWRSVRPLIVRHIGADNSQGDGFRSLLESLEPSAPELEGWQGPADESSGEGLTALIDATELEDVESWWHEPEPEPQVGSASRDRRRPSTAYVFGPLSIAGGAIGCAGGVILVAAILLLSSRRKVLRFRWYATAAIWLGVTAGFVLGARAPEAPAPPAAAQTSSTAGDMGR